MMLHYANPSLPFGDANPLVMMHQAGAPASVGSGYGSATVSAGGAYSYSPLALQQQQPSFGGIPPFASHPSSMPYTAPSMMSMPLGGIATSSSPFPSSSSSSSVPSTSFTSLSGPPPCAVCMRLCHAGRILLDFDPATNVRWYACSSDCERRWQRPPTQPRLPSPPTAPAAFPGGASFRVEPSIVSPPIPSRTTSRTHNNNSINNKNKNKQGGLRVDRKPYALSSQGRKTRSRESPPRRGERSNANKKPSSQQAGSMGATQEQGMKMTPQLAQQIKSACFVVIDTNAWITSLDAVLSLRHYHPQLTVIVPSAVVQELDGLKNADNTNDDKLPPRQRGLGFKARAAIKAIYEATASGESWIRGQRYDEHLGAAFKTANRDDEILSCALYFHSRVSPSALITGDYGLALKCTINRVPTTDMRGLLESLPAVSMLNNDNNNNDHQLTGSNGLLKRKVIDEMESTSAGSSAGIAPRKRQRRTMPGQPDIPGFSFTSPQTSDDETGEEEYDGEDGAQDPSALSLLCSLPGELQIKVMSFLSPRALLQAERASRSLRQLLVVENPLSAAIWADALQRSHGRHAPSYGGQHPKHWYLRWRRSVVPPHDHDHDHRQH